jgi:hypothetical protein
MWPNWVCPSCRGVHGLGPVVIPEGGDPSVTAEERLVNSTVMGLLDVAAGLRHGAARSLHRLHDEECRKCGGSGLKAPLVLCDGAGCPRAWHASCAPGLSGSVPAGEWLCPECSSGADLGVSSEAAPASSASARASAPDAREAAQVSSKGCSRADRSSSSSPATETSSASVASGEVLPEVVPAFSAGATAEGSTGSVETAIPFDGVLESWVGSSRQWTKLLERVQADRSKAELRDQPVYTRLKANRWLVKRPKLALRGKRGGECDACTCSERQDACGDSCLNRSLNMECTKATCGYGDDPERRCHNRDLQRHNKSKVSVRPTPGKGWGLFAAADIPAGALVVEYVGEVLDDAGTEARLLEYKAAGQHHFHIMEISKDLVIGEAGCRDERKSPLHAVAILRPHELYVFNVFTCNDPCRCWKVW